MLYLTIWESTTLVYLWFTAACSQRSLCHDSYMCTCLNHELQTTWADFHVCPHTIKSCLLCVYPWCHARDKKYQAPPSLVGRGWEQGYNYVLSSEYAYISWERIWVFNSESYITARCVFINSDGVPNSTVHWADYSTHVEPCFIYSIAHTVKTRGCSTHTIPLWSLHGLEYVPDKIRKEFAAAPMYYAHVYLLKSLENI